MAKIRGQLPAEIQQQTKFPRLTTSNKPNPANNHGAFKVGPSPADISDELTVLANAWAASLVGVSKQKML